LVNKGKGQPKTTENRQRQKDQKTGNAKGYNWGSVNKAKRQHQTTGFTQQNSPGSGDLNNAAGQVSQASYLV
jgi:hypothetical protein